MKPKFKIGDVIDAVGFPVPCVIKKIVYDDTFAGGGCYVLGRADKKKVFNWKLSFEADDTKLNTDFKAKEKFQQDLEDLFNE